MVALYCLFIDGISFYYLQSFHVWLAYSLSFLGLSAVFLLKWPEEAARLLFYLQKLTAYPLFIPLACSLNCMPVEFKFLPHPLLKRLKEREIVNKYKMYFPASVIFRIGALVKNRL